MNEIVQCSRIPVNTVSFEQRSFVVVEAKYASSLMKPA